MPAGHRRIRDCLQRPAVAVGGFLLLTRSLCKLWQVAPSPTCHGLNPTASRPTKPRWPRPPPGLTVRVTQERTQQANRAIALQRLRARLLVVLEEQRAAELAQIRGDLVKAEWGQQIRNYVLHPYK